MERTEQANPDPTVETAAARDVVMGPPPKMVWVEEESVEDDDTGEEYEAGDEDQSGDDEESDDNDEFDLNDETQDKEELYDENELGKENKSGDEDEPGHENDSSHENKSGLENKSSNENASSDKMALCDEYEPTDEDEADSRGLTKESIALRQIRQYQRGSELLIGKLPFQRLVGEIYHDFFEEHCRHERRMQASAVEALQEATEAYLIEFFQDANQLAIYSKHDKLHRSDMVMIGNLRARREPWLAWGNPLENM